VGCSRVPHPFATRYPTVLPPTGTPFDLHVLSTPPAFVLSQDQTLHRNQPLVTGEPAPRGTSVKSSSRTSRRAELSVSSEAFAAGLASHSAQSDRATKSFPTWPPALAFIVLSSVFKEPLARRHATSMRRRCRCPSSASAVSAALRGGKTSYRTASRSSTRPGRFFGEPGARSLLCRGRHRKRHSSGGAT
jgi:hypothetical protein